MLLTSNWPEPVLIRSSTGSGYFVCFLGKYCLVIGGGMAMALLRKSMYIYNVVNNW